RRRRTSRRKWPPRRTRKRRSPVRGIGARPSNTESIMPEMTIRLRINPATGKKDIIIALSGDEDALPHEHEQQHRALVDKLIEGGIVKASDLGKISVEREEDAKVPALPSGADKQGQKQAQGQGG